MRLGRLYALAGAWERLSTWLADEEQVSILRKLHAELAPRLRLPVQATSRAGVLRRAVLELPDSIERFNRRWREFVQNVDAGHVNELRAAYNRYSGLEEEC